MRTVLFVCTGNTCRSPMAEAIARNALLTDPTLQPLRDEVFVASAGVSALDGVPTTLETVEALAAAGIEFDGRSKRLSDAMIRKAALVVCMTDGHRQVARGLVDDSPEDAAKVVLLDRGGEDIADPVGQGRAAYDALFARLSRLIPDRLRELLGRPTQATPARGR